MKYKLLKDLPWITAWAEFIEHEDTETFSRIAFSHVPCVWQKFAKDNPDFFEPIVENKTYDDLKEWDIAWYIDSEWIVFDAIFSKKDSRSNTFLTPEEAEDENKRREWAVRPDRYIPELWTYYYSYTDSKNSKIDALKNFWDSIDCLTINNWLAFRSEKECQEAIGKHDLVRLFYKIR